VIAPGIHSKENKAAVTIRDVPSAPAKKSARMESCLLKKDSPSTAATL
jgi:hypothetical protein